MIRLNAFVTLKETADADKVLALAKELVESSRKDEGNVAYDIFCSGTNPKVMMFCETWQNADVLDKHSKSEHFTRLVPAIEAYTESGLKCEQFEFGK